MEGIRKAFEALRRVRHIEWILVMLALGVALLFLSDTIAPAPDPPSVPAAAQASGTLEERMALTLSSVQGAGDVRVLLHRAGGEEGDVTGVIVVAAGAQDLGVRLELMRAVQSLLGVPQKNIEVLTMTNESIESEETP